MINVYDLIHPIICGQLQSKLWRNSVEWCDWVNSQRSPRYAWVIAQGYESLCKKRHVYFFKKYTSIYSYMLIVLRI